MTRLLRLLTAAASVLCWTAVSPSVRAQGPAFVAPCGDATSFHTRLEALAGVAPQLPGFSVEIEPTADGRFVLSVRGEPGDERRVEGASCEELVDVAAVILALRMGRSHGPARPPDAAAGSGQERTVVDAERGARLSAPAPEPRHASSRDVSGAASLSLPGWLRGLGVVVSFGLDLGTIAPLAGVARGGFTYERGRAFGELGFAYHVPRATKDGVATVGRVGALAMGCVRAHPNVFPCAGVDLGSMRAEGGAVPGAREDTGFQAAVRLALRVPVALHPVVRLDFRLGGAAPLPRYEVRLRDGSVSYRQSPVSGELSIGLSVHFE